LADARRMAATWREAALGMGGFFELIQTCETHSAHKDNTLIFAWFNRLSAGLRR
jgi:hypothetical protein